ncbi:MAG TPA: hypothetical protein VF653_12420 [Methylomirabilota bacterium]
MTEKGDGLVVNPAYTPDRHGESGERKILSQALRDLIEKEEYAIAVQLARALIAAASLPDERCVAAQKLMYDRLEGPVERVLHHSVDALTQKRIVIDPSLLPERESITRGIGSIALLAAQNGNGNAEGHANGHTNGHSNGHSNGNGHTNGHGEE